MPNIFQKKICRMTSASGKAVPPTGDRSVAPFPLFLSTTTTTPNANATTSNNNTDSSMNTSKLTPSLVNKRLQAANGASIHTLEAVTTSDDAFPPLKLAVVEALSIIEIIKVPGFTLINLRNLFDNQIRNSTQTREPGPPVRIVSLRASRRLFSIHANIARIRFHLLCNLGLIV